MEFTEPTPLYHASLLAACDEFDRVEAGSGPGWVGAFGLTRAQLADSSHFDEYCERMEREKTQAAPGMVRATMLWAVGPLDGCSEQQWLGRVSARHELNDELFNVAGHIGYAVRPTARGRGVATALARAGLDVLREVGVEDALITCDEDNVASSRVIERVGGKFEKVAAGKKRYWVPTAP